MSEIITPFDQVKVRRFATGLTLSDRKRSAGGYTLFAPLTAQGKVYLIDSDGKIVHKWKLPVRPGRDAVILPNGNLGYNGTHATSAALYPAWDIWHGGDFYEVTPSGEIVWQYQDIFHHHDAQWLPNGHLLYTAAQPIPANIAARIRGGDKRRDAPDGIIQGDVIREVNRTGEIVWEWRVWEHLRPEDFPIHDIFDRRHWPMINGLSLTSDGLVLMSLRCTSGVIAVNHASGKLVWHVGHDVLAQQHTPIQTAKGKVLVFDNGNLRTGFTSPHSKVLEFDVKSGEITWQYTDPLLPSFFSPYMGSAQRLENGNTFICESAFGRLFEVTPEGEVVWEYIIPFFAEYPENIKRMISGYQNSAFRAHRYPAEAIPWLQCKNQVAA